MAEIENFVCSICGNVNKRFVGTRNGKKYCRKCISFRGQEASGEYTQNDDAEYTLRYSLSKEQQELSDILVKNFKNGLDSMVNAVCGSGKTEIVMKVISYAIKNKKKVGFSVPRKDVVIELQERFKDVFKKNVVVSVYGGHTSIIEGDLVCLTTHQLFRFDNYFDLLIMDEIDAYPFKGNDVLEKMCRRSVKGNLILMSATSKEKEVRGLFKHNYNKVELYTRFHGHPLPVPKIIKGNSFYLLFNLIRETKRFIRNGKPVFIFVPTIEICEKTYDFLKYFIKNGDFVHSQKESRNDTISRFRKGKIKYLVTTAVLERGVTVRDVQVIILFADSSIYNAAALVQISGRVGRKIDAPDGEVIYLAKSNTKDMIESIQIIQDANNKLFKKRRNPYENI